MSSLSLRHSALLNLPGAAVLRVLAKRIETRRSRLALSRLDARLLDDIGVSAETAARESGRVFWRE